MFDNDGTLWGETLIYFRFFVAVDRLKHMAEADPVSSPPISLAATAGNMQAGVASREERLIEIVEVIRSGRSIAMSISEAHAWLPSTVPFRKTASNGGALTPDPNG